MEQEAQINQLMNSGQFEKAIQTLSNLLEQTHQPYWYCKRSEAYLRVGQALKAYQDSEIAYQLIPNAESCLRRGNALLRLEKVEEASEYFEEGKKRLSNQSDPIWNELHRGEVCTALLRNATRSLGSQLENEFECVLCLKLFFEPATLPCGHTFCRSCIGQATLFNNKCPLCRTVFHSNFKPPVTVSLNNIIEKLFPEEYAARRLEAKQEESDNRMTLPLFIMNGICFPGEDFPLHVYEPRYRIMLKRVMQGCRHFGLLNVQEDPSNQEGYSIFSVGCCLEVSQCETLPDGRSLVQTKAVRRFKVLERTMTDGYWVAKVEYLTDKLAQNEQELNLLKNMIKKIRTLVSQVLEQNDGTQDLSQLEQIVQRMDFPETPEQCNQFSYWVCSILPISSQLKQPLIEMDSAVDRLRRVIALLEKVAGNSNCALL